MPHVQSGMRRKSNCGEAGSQTRRNTRSECEGRRLDLLAGLLTLAVYQTALLALVQLLCFTVWGFATGFSLLRARHTRAVTAR